MVLLLPISRVAPSGEAPATKLAAISPAAPGLFTTIVGVALAVERNSAMARAPKALPQALALQALPWLLPAWSRLAPPSAAGLNT